MAELADGSKAAFHFVAKTHPEGTLLDDSRLLGPGAPFELVIGKKFILPIWEEAVKGMAVGERKTFVAPPAAVANYATLASVLRRQGRDADKKKAEAEADEAHGHGHGHSHSHGSGGDSGGGHACSCAAALDPADLDLHMLGGTQLEFELELLQVTPPGGYEREDWELSWEQKAATVPELKEAGNACFKAGDYAGAAKEYRKALQYLEGLELADSSAEDLGGLDVAATVGSYRSALLLNYAASKLKLEDFPAVVEATTMVLEAAGESQNAKAFFRRGQAHLQRGRDIDLAESDLTTASRLAPDNGSIRKALAACQKVVAAGKKEDSARFKGMF